MKARRFQRKRRKAVPDKKTRWEKVGPPERKCQIWEESEFAFRQVVALSVSSAGAYTRGKATFAASSLAEAACIRRRYGEFMPVPEGA